MTQVHIAEGLLTVPDDWDDKTVNVFMKELPSGENASIVVTRDRLTEPLDQYVARTLRGLSQTLPRFTLLSRHERAVGPLTGHELVLRWTREGSPIHQQQVYVEYFSKILTFTLTAPQESAQEAAKAFSEVLDEVKLRKPEG
jgi:hypothetical protein